MIDSLPLFFVFLFACQFFCILTMSPLNIGLMESVPMQARGLALGMATFVMHLCGDVPSAFFYGVVADKVTTTSIADSKFNLAVYNDPSLFSLECNLATINIYQTNATLDAAQTKAISDNSYLLDIVRRLQDACTGSTCIDYGKVLNDACADGQRAGMVLLDVGIVICTVLCIIAWWKSKTASSERRFSSPGLPVTSMASNESEMTIQSSRRQTPIEDCDLHGSFDVK